LVVELDGFVPLAGVVAFLRLLIKGLGTLRVRRTGTQEWGKIFIVAAGCREKCHGREDEAEGSHGRKLMARPWSGQARSRLTGAAGRRTGRRRRSQLRGRRISCRAAPVRRDRRWSFLRVRRPCP